MNARKVPRLVKLVWLILLGAVAVSVWSQHWSNLFVTTTALLLTVVPVAFSERYQIRLPRAFLVGITLFVFGTLFLGEVYDFYERFWWWDVLLHGMSALGFGVAGFLFIFYLFEGNRYAAPPWALGMIAFCLALALGTLWEIFEFAMDQLFGLNMQKSGLVDTMSDLIVDTVGAGIGALSGFFWLKGRQVGAAGMIEEFIRLNRTAFRKLKDQAEARWPPNAKGR